MWCVFRSFAVDMESVNGIIETSISTTGNIGIALVCGFVVPQRHLLQVEGCFCLFDEENHTLGNARLKDADTCYQMHFLDL